MTLIKTDVLNRFQHTVVTPKEAFEEAIYMASIGWERREERTEIEHQKLVEVIGALLNTLSSKGILKEPDVVAILNCSTITNES